MLQNDGIHFIPASLKLPLFSPHPHPQPSTPFFSSLQFSSHRKFPKIPFNFNFNFNHINSLFQFVKTPFFNFNVEKPHDEFNHFGSMPSKSSLLCCASLSLIDSDSGPPKKSNDDSGVMIQSKAQNVSSSRPGAEERVLISEVLVRNKDGEELERKDLENEALNALKASRANSALTVREVQEDVHRIIASGYFFSCMPVAVDTRDGIRLVFQVLWSLIMLIFNMRVPI